MASTLWTSQFKTLKWRLQGYLLGLPRKWMKRVHYLAPSEWVPSFKTIKDSGCHHASLAHLPTFKSNCWNTSSWYLSLTPFFCTLSDAGLWKSPWFYSLNHYLWLPGLLFVPLFFTISHHSNGYVISTLWIFISCSIYFYWNVNQWVWWYFVVP